MTGPARIASPGNDRVKQLVRLRDRRHRDRTGLTLVEEPLVIRRARDAGHPVREVWYCPGQESPDTRALREELVAAGAAAVEAAPRVMDRVAYRGRSEGLLVVVPRLGRRLEDVALPHADPLVAVLEAVEKPGNLGAVQRIADGAGAHALLVCDGGTDLDNPNVLRASRGACFALPTAAAPGDAVRAWLAARGVRTVAAVPDAPRPWDACDLTGPVAVVLGAEHAGLSAAWREAADERVALPMAGAGDSLNVAATAAVLLFEAVRQRRARQEA